MSKLIKQYEPATLAIESLFFNKNQKTAIHVAEARGAITVAAVRAGVLVHEYSPQAVKIAVTGSGNAAKEGVIRMVDRLLTLPKRRRLDDEYDAIALGICHTNNPHARGLQPK
jgi:crossover junction endodeoxyribonuclease RuvC